MLICVRTGLIGDGMKFVGASFEFRLSADECLVVAALLSRFHHFNSFHSISPTNMKIKAIIFRTCNSISKTKGAATFSVAF
jgi:hypothetical protein